MDSDQLEHTIVTGSDRLARHLHERHAQAQLAAGRKVWLRPDILPVGAFWRRLANILQHDPASPLARRRLLSRHAMLARWEQLLAESFSAQPLLQLSGAARTALDAWQLCHDWLLDVATLADDPLEETRLLIEWGRRFEAECAAASLLPDYALPEAVLAALEQSESARQHLPPCIRLAGFLEFAPRERQQWDALQALGVAVERFPEPAGENRVSNLPCADARAEILAASAWTRAQLAGNPEARIAIVVPDLAGRRAALKRELLEALAPERLASFSGKPLPFNFSLGEALAKRALVADAITWLGFADNTVTFADAARICRSPYFAPAAEAAMRLSLEAVLRREGYAEFSLADWRRLAEQKDCPALAATIARFREHARREANDALPSEWARRFSRWLDDAGWCRGRPLDSDEYQAREAWHEVLGRLVELDAVLGKSSRAVAFGWLRRLAGDTPFQPRAADAPVQVMGLLEATGMHFDAVWIMGMTDDTLPAAPRPNPFLPVAVQRARGLPQSSAERELEFARQLFAGLCASAQEVMFSHPLREKDAELSASPLLQDLPEADPPPAYASLTGVLFRAAPLEVLDDRRGPPHAGGALRGGTALLQNQSHCAFRAFAVHRLRADDWPSPQPGPDAMTRGLLAHRVLERLWQHWRDRQSLQRARDDGELNAAVHAAVSDLVDADVRRAPYRWRDSLRNIEIERLTRVLLRWFEGVELSRPDFSVREIEGLRSDGSEVNTEVRAGPLVLRGKLDRVDRLADGGELIIDYKTGEAPRPTHFFGERPAAPQLPAYLVARRQAGEPTPVGIAVASLRTGRENLHGVMHVEGDARHAGIAGMVNVAKSGQVNDWSEAVAHWESVIHALGESFAAGDASVDPLPGACTWCHLATFCRIHEQARETMEEDND